MKNAEKNRRAKVSYVSMNEKNVSAKAGGKKLISFDFVILMQDKMRSFKKYVVPETLVRFSV